MAQPLPVSVAHWQQQLTPASGDSTRLRACLAIAQYYYTKNQYDSLYPYVQRGLQLLPNAFAHGYASELYFLLSRYHRDKGHYRKGIPFGMLSVQHALQNQQPKRTAELQYYLAVLYEDAGELSKAVDQIGVNLRYLQAHDDGPTRGANYLLLIGHYQSLHNPTMEEQYWRKYVALNKRFWPAEDKIIAYLNAGERLESAGQLLGAERQFRAALAQANRGVFPVAHTTYIRQALGANARKQGHYPIAVAWFQQAFVNASTVQYVAGLRDTKRELALTYLAWQRLPDAHREARQALSFARRINAKSGIVASLNCLGAVLEAQGNYQQALGLYRQEQRLNEQAAAETSQQKIAQMQARFDTETKENTIHLLQKNAQINHLTTLRQHEQLVSASQTQLGGLLLMSLLLFGVGLTINSLQKSRRGNALLTQQRTLLIRTTDQLTEANRVKDKLFSLIAHDLRSPMATMKNSLRQLREDHQPPDQLVSLTKRLDKQVDTLLGLLTNLLDWSMIQLKETPMNLKDVPLAEVVCEVLSQVSEQIDQKQLLLINQVNGHHVARSNAYQLQAVIRNLVSNAIKFTPVGGSIRLVSYQKAAWLELQVRDSGVGMSAEQLAVVFTAPQVQPSTQGETGTGLGLRLCRDMLDRQGGQLQIESRLGQGTTVRVQLLPAVINYVQ